MSKKKKGFPALLARLAKMFLVLFLVFYTGFYLAQIEWIELAYKQYKWEMATEWTSDAKEPLDKQITAWGAVPNALQGGAVLIGAEFSKNIAMLLVDQGGKILWRWTLENHVYNPETMKWWKDDITTKEGFLIDDARLLPGGDVVFIQSLMDVNNLRGQRLARMDPYGRILWEVPGTFHHFIYIADNPQKIYTMLSRVRQDFPEVAAPMGGLAYLEDWIEVYGMDGKRLGGWSIVDAFAHSPYRTWLPTFEIDLPEIQRIVMPNGKVLYDLLHLNCVQYLDAAKAKALPEAREGDLLVSFRAISAIAVFRPGTGQIVWAAKGPWRHQHSVEVRDDNKLYLFDNDGKKVILGWEQEESRVVRYNPFNGQMDEIFSAPELHSLYMGNYQQLANGSWVISAPFKGRVVVVSPKKQILWQLRTVDSPYRDPIPRGKEISFMHYYPAQALKFLDSAKDPAH